MVTGCYSAMQSGDFIKRCMIWGELRADNIVAGTGTESITDLTNIIKENINSNNGYTKWLKFYDVINRCNPVLKYAPEVSVKDPSYTQSDLKATQAEVSALRDLCYFYLIRTFRDVPYYTFAYTDDNQDLAIPATSFDVVLDSLIGDLENVQNNAMKSYPETKPKYNTGRITQDAIHAMLADMYLWKGDYDNCIKYSDLVINSKLNKYKEEKSSARRASDDDENDLINGFPLISELRSGSNNYGEAFNEIFCDGNSSESIFELDFEDDQKMLANGAISSFYGNQSTKRGNFAPADYIASDVSGEIYKVFKNKFDTRCWENFSEVNDEEYGITKYAVRSASVSYTTTPPTVDAGEYYSSSYCSANWMFYRLMHAILMKAEALTQLVNTTDVSGAYNNYNDSILRAAFNLVNAVNKRSYGSKTLTDTLRFVNFSSKGLREYLVYDERQRELMFEGKRWFDLVRRSRREGSTTYLREEVKRKSTDGNASASQNKLVKLDGIYWPYNEDELKANTYLKQNPAFNSGEQDSYEITK